VKHGLPCRAKPLPLFYRGVFPVYPVAATSRRRVNREYSPIEAIIFMQVHSQQGISVSPASPFRLFNLT
jgi:hypothetical protein